MDLLQTHVQCHIGSGITQEHKMVSHTALQG